MTQAPPPPVSSQRVDFNLPPLPTLTLAFGLLTMPRTRTRTRTVTGAIPGNLDVHEQSSITFFDGCSRGPLLEVTICSRHAITVQLPSWFCQHPNAAIAALGGRTQDVDNLNAVQCLAYADRLGDLSPITQCVFRLVSANKAREEGRTIFDSLPEGNTRLRVLRSMELVANFLCHPPIHAELRAYVERPLFAWKTFVSGSYIPADGLRNMAVLTRLLTQINAGGQTVTGAQLKTVYNSIAGVEPRPRRAAAEAATEAIRLIAASEVARSEPVRRQTVDEYINSTLHDAPHRTQDDEGRACAIAYVAGLPTWVGRPTSPCSVCLQEGESAEDWVCLGCTHPFHRKCIRSSVTQTQGANSLSCPSCRQSVFLVPSTVIPVEEHADHPGLTIVSSPVASAAVPRPPVVQEREAAGVEEAGGLGEEEEGGAAAVEHNEARAVEEDDVPAVEEGATRAVEEDEARVVEEAYAAAVEEDEAGAAEIEHIAAPVDAAPPRATRLPRVIDVAHTSSESSSVNQRKRRRDEQHDFQHRARELSHTECRGTAEEYKQFCRMLEEYGVLHNAGERQRLMMRGYALMTGV
jgi:hypothetical protein